MMSVYDHSSTPLMYDPFTMKPIGADWKLTIHGIPIYNSSVMVLCKEGLGNDAEPVLNHTNDEYPFAYLLTPDANGACYIAFSKKDLFAPIKLHVRASGFKAFQTVVTLQATDMVMHAQLFEDRDFEKDVELQELEKPSTVDGKGWMKEITEL